MAELLVDEKNFESYQQVLPYRDTQDDDAETNAAPQIIKVVVVIVIKVVMVATGWRSDVGSEVI